LRGISIKKISSEELGAHASCNAYASMGLQARPNIHTNIVYKMTIFVLVAVNVKKQNNHMEKL
jgi:hypothetical protein